MGKNFINWKTKGMNRDMSVSAFNPEFAFENINLRLSTNEGNTMMSWVSERGPKELTLNIDTMPFASSVPSDRYTGSIVGTPIGTAVLNHKLVLFTVNGIDSYIYVFQVSQDNDTKLEGKLLHKGNLGFSVLYPIETLVSYESESIQKVYWTDGKNQPRVINIAQTKSYNDGSFDFVQDLALREEVKVTKIFGSGEFPAGVIQYAFTYYNKYGQESNIFYTTPLQYISYVDRGGSPESKIANSFKIKVTNLDRNFEYLRIYSILRTSVNATPFCKRIQDIEITSNEASFIDTGLQGDTIDPTELLYKGGEQITAGTLEQKDGTLFLGNIKVTRPFIDIQNKVLTANGVVTESSKYPLATANITSVAVNRPFSLVSNNPFSYINTLSCPEGYDYQGAVGFKSKEYYRLGIQFQYKNGKWSEPCWIGDQRQTAFPTTGSSTSIKGYATINVPEFEFTLKNVFSELYNAGYRRVRPVFAVPKLSDRTVICQGVGCPTVTRKVDRYSDADGSSTGIWSGNSEGKLYAQSSWLFRIPMPFISNPSASIYENGDASNGGGKVTYIGKLKSQFDTPVIASGESSSDSYLKVMSPYLRSTEVMGKYDDGHAFYVDDYFATVHSPELEFDTSFSSMDLNKCSMRLVGYAGFSHTYGDIDIQTSTPAIGSDAAGFTHRSVVTDGGAALVSAPFFNDYLVDEIKGSSPQRYEAYNTTSPAVDFPVYMWHKNGSLNNDVARDSRSAVLLKKRMSNYRLSDGTSYLNDSSIFNYDVEDMQLFNSDELSVIKVSGHTYMGNIETMLTPATPSPYFLVGNPWRKSVDTGFTSDSYYYLALSNPNDTSSKNGVWYWQKTNDKWGWSSNNGSGSDIGDVVKGLVQWREPISMKYKSTSHIVVNLKRSSSFGNMLSSTGIYHATNGEPIYNSLPMVEVTREYNKDTLYGGTSDEALQAATWIPCGPPVSFNSVDTSKVIHFKWGDTYYQRFECLKTYPFTSEDKNQVVEIASFMCETRMNIDGRYDRNRAQVSNLNMTPQNFNLLNPIYSQMDNFFSYRMLDKDEYKKVVYPNNITWTKTKQNGADVDLWTNITMANALELDGDKESISKLIRLNNQLIAFQDRGISQILYNENTQISTTEGVPIEIANSNKVQGKRYFSDTVGCSNKWSIVQTPAGIYFMDSNEKSIYLFNGQLNNLSTVGGFNSWAKQNIPSSKVSWNPSSFGTFIAFYDKQNQDVLFINSSTALAYSEKFNCFTSFYDYGDVPFYENLDDIGIWVKGGKLWKHQAGEYCNFFDVKKPFSMTLIANQEPQMDKTFTNLEFRACIDGDGTSNGNRFVPYLPFDTIEVWDEYQHGLLTLGNRNRGGRIAHGSSNGILARKFRIWRCDIPRDNAKVDTSTEAPMGIKRFKTNPLDRMRNPWVYLKLTKNAVGYNESFSKREIHDIMVTYFT